MISEKIDQELYDYLSGNLTEEEIIHVEKWIQTDTENKLYFQQYKNDFLKMRWGIRAHLISGNFKQIRKTIQKHRQFKILRSIAAIVILLMSVGTGLFFYYHTLSPIQPPFSQNETIVPGKSQAILVLASGETVKLDSNMQEVKEQNGISIRINQKGALNYYISDTSTTAPSLYNRLIIPKGGEFTIQLADGTKVWLNAATEFRYPVTFSGNNREVYLKGEAYFEVKKDSEHPFIVTANDIKIKVYGTKFNVNNYTPSKIETVLVEGSIGMIHENNEILLKPGQKGQSVSGTILVSNVDVNSYIAWKDGNFIFENKPLEDVMNELSRWYDVDVFYSRENIRNIRISGDMKRYKDIQSLLYYFERISDIRFSIKGKTIIIE